jgi:serine/threonine protein kinase
MSGAYMTLKLGNYTVIEEIGRGGMAVVYRAVQESLNRNVAIKELE